MCKKRCVSRQALVLACLGLFVNVVPVSAQSEATVRGQVVAAADGSLLPKAAVTLRALRQAPGRSGQAVPTGESMQTTADETGRFVFQRLTPGEYLVSGSADGFVPREMRLMIDPREARMVTLALDLRGVDASVEVTGEATALPSTYSPSSTFLTGERLEHTPQAQQNNLPEMIVTAAPGMIRGHDDFVHIRGHEVALNPLINGVSFWENPHALFSGGFSPAIIESANVMTGGFPAEYGNRFGGVVDIVTKSGLRMENDGTFMVSGGQAGRRSVGGDFGGHSGPGDRFAYYAFGSIFASDRFLSPPDREAIHDGGRGGHGFVQLDGNLTNAGSLRVVVMGDGASFEIPKTPDDVRLRPLANAEQRTRQQTAIAGWSHASPRVALAASFYQRWSRTQLDPAAGPLTAKAQLSRELRTLGGKVDLTRFAGRHVLKAGIDAVRLRPREDLAYDYNGYREFSHLVGLPHIHVTDNVIDFSSRDSGGQVSGYVQDAVQLGNRVTADLGVRLDRYALLASATHVSPRANVAFRLGGGAVVHASYNHFFVPPPVEGVLSSGAGLTARIQEIGIPCPPNEPTTENQFEIGASAPAGPFRFALTGYHRATDNPVHTTVWPDARIYSYASFERARAYGLEAKAEVPAFARYGVTGYLNYALGRVYFYNPVSGGFVTEAGHLTETSRFQAPMDQTHTMTTGITYRPTTTGLWIGTAMEYGSGTPMGHGGSAHEHGAGDAAHVDAASAAGAPRVPGHFTANLSTGIDLWRDGNRRPKLSLQVDVENLTDNRYLIAQEGEFSPRQFSIPRLVSVTAKFRF
jgi:hypothetical protein